MNDMDIRKIVVKQCFDYKWIVFKPFRGDWCHHPEVSITKIENPRKIPNFCPLDADINHNSLVEHSKQVVEERKNDFVNIDE